MEKYKTNEVKTVSEEERLEEERIAKESEKEVAQKDAKIIDAVRKNYPEEADRIIAKLKGENSNTRTTEENEKNPEIEWYELTARVLEENKVTGEEKELLKTFLDDSRLTVKQENE